MNSFSKPNKIDCPNCYKRYYKFSSGHFLCKYCGCSFKISDFYEISDISNNNPTMADRIVLWLSFPAAIGIFIIAVLQLDYAEYFVKYLSTFFIFLIILGISISVISSMKKGFMYITGIRFYLKENPIGYFGLFALSLIVVIGFVYMIYGISTIA